MERKLRIMVVDDEQIVLDSVRKHLKKENYILQTVLSSPSALSQIRSEPPDIILTDLMMPEIDGLQLMKEVEKMVPGLPIIMITGYATINTALQATQLGAFDYIAKPFTRAELTTVIGRAAELVRSMKVNGANGKDIENEAAENVRPIKHVGEHVWMMVEASGTVLLGIERPFLTTIGQIRTMVLPAVGDEIRQGSGYVQIFTSDLRTHTLLSPLSGSVVQVNTEVVRRFDAIFEDPYGEGWLIRLRPNRFDIEIKELDL